MQIFCILNQQQAEPLLGLSSQLCSGHALIMSLSLNVTDQIFQTLFKCTIPFFPSFCWCALLSYLTWAVKRHLVRQASLLPQGRGHICGVNSEYGSDAVSASPAMNITAWHCHLERHYCLETRGWTWCGRQYWDPLRWSSWCGHC